MSLKPVDFIGEEIQVAFDTPPVMEKAPDCPDRFTWRDATYEVTRLLNAWQDFGRRGRMTLNMSAPHLMLAQRRGSWGVGRYYFRVETAEGQIFDLYYDRAPKDVDRRKGAWFLYRELAEEDEGSSP